MEEGQCPFVRDQVQEAVEKAWTPRRPAPCVEAYFRQLSDDEEGQHPPGQDAPGAQTHRDDGNLRTPPREASSASRRSAPGPENGRSLGTLVL